MSNSEKKLTVPEGSCAFFIERKRRYCRFKPNIGNIYCAEHAGLLGIETTRKRIKCPLNSKHTCYEDQLNKHLKKCRKQQDDLPVYHIEGINSGTTDSQEAGENQATKMAWADIPLTELQRLIDKVKQVYQDHAESIESEILNHSCLEEELSNETFRIPALRHRKQQASLIGHLDKMGLLTNDRCYVELGAGKGMLSHWIQKAVDNCTNTAFLLVDRGCVRYKADNQHKWGESGPKFERIRIDIANLHLGKVPSIHENERSVVTVGKHLCGGATDLTVRCVTKTLIEDISHVNESHGIEDLDQQPDCKKVKTHNIRCKFAGMTIALCCHHRCTWEAYVGKDFMKTHGFSARDFSLLCKLSGWASATWKGWKTVEQMNQEINSTRKSEKGCTSCVINETEDTSSSVINKALPCEGELQNSGQMLPVEMDSGATGKSEGMNTVQSEDRSKHVEDQLTPEDEEDDHVSGPSLTRTDLILPTKAREMIGRQCKRLIDFGRVEYLRKHNMNCRLVVYIDERLTPENVAIIAQPKS